MYLNDQFPTQSCTKNNFLISTDASLLDVEMIHRYLTNESYWAKGRSIEIVQRSLQFSFCFGVYALNDGSQAQQIGLARVISDFATFAYLADVFILPEFQGNGLGKWLIEFLLAHPALTTLNRFTLYTNDAHSLYTQFGFAIEPTPEKHMVYRPNATI